MTDYKEILQKPPIPRYIGNYIVTPHAPPQLKQPGGAHLVINIGINIYPTQYRIKSVIWFTTASWIRKTPSNS